MNVLFVDPPAGFDEIGGAKRGFRRVMNVIPSLGLAYLAAVAEREGHRAAIRDCAFGQWNIDDMRPDRLGFKPDFIGMAALTPTFENCITAAGKLRRLYPDAFFICGGPHPTADPRDVLDRTDVFDLLVLGEGEETLKEILGWLDAGKPYPPDRIRGTAFCRGNEFVITGERPFIRDLDTLPFPARHLLPPLSQYQPTPASYLHLPLGVMMTSRGCPGTCTFCDRAVFGRRCRSRSVDNIMEEVRELVERCGAREIRFFDDTFTIDRKRVEEICARFRRDWPRLAWTCLTRVNCVDRELLVTMKKSGCWQVLFGLEAGDDDVLERLGKGTTVEMNRRAVMAAHEAGLSVRADFIVGVPGQTMENLRRTLEFALSLPLDFAHFNKFVPYPGTELYRNLVAQGRKFEFDNSSFISNHDEVGFVPDTLSREEYIRFLDESFKRFYLRPGYILRRLAGLRSWDQVKGHFQGLLSILSL